MYRIMIIEDDSFLCDLLKESLEKYDYEVYIPNNFRDIVKEFREVNPDLVLLDINIPYYDGFYICKTIRRESRVPIIFISARNGEMDQIMGMELGADDYIVKPFSLEIVLTKIKSTIRRVYGEYAQETNVKIHSFYIDEKSFKMYYKEQGQELTKTELKLMKKLFDSRDSVVSREDLLEEMWDESFIAGDNALTVNITRLKGKLALIGIHDAIKTKRGAGYYFDTAALTGGKDE
ncbi:DNA-binding response regulator [Bacillus sp. HMF5848]|uniref:response regulator transcription factor n=1 Tax=Bacillus sp. HMF5848 TaxID=2495421 RepID=UPI000F7839DD|nr:response regulator transcription factor [Bacillus sp. HMF5848]RSK26101.1 DNA-binding response regulator [Bacillus sp. HMF5848]